MKLLKALNIQKARINFYHILEGFWNIEFIVMKGLTFKWIPRLHNLKFPTNSAVSHENNFSLKVPMLFC